MGRRKKKKLEDYLEEVKTQVGKILDNANPKDLIYVVAWLSATLLIYQRLTGSRYKSIVEFRKGLWGIDLTSKTPTFDINNLALSFIGGYIVVNLDIGDIAQVFNAVKTGFGIF